jgi:cellulose biosynthesis protein BcsQ
MEQLNIWIAITSLAVVIQAGILVALYVSVRKSSARMETILSDLHKKTTPILESTQSIVVDSRPKIEAITDNLLAASTSIKSQVERLDATVSDAVDRTRLQIIRADDLVTRTMDRVEETTDIVHKTVISPVRQMAGLVTGLTTGIGAFFGRRGNSEREDSPQDEEMFI